MSSIDKIVDKLAKDKMIDKMIELVARGAKPNNNNFKLMNDEGLLMMVPSNDEPKPQLTLNNLLNKNEPQQQLREDDKYPDSDPTFEFDVQLLSKRFVGRFYSELSAQPPVYYNKIKVNYVHKIWGDKFMR